MASISSYIFLYICYLAVIGYDCWYSIRAEKKMAKLEQEIIDLKTNNKEDK